MSTVNVVTVASEVAAHTSRALSSLLGKQVRVLLQTTGVKKVTELGPTFSPDEAVAIVLMRVTGDTEGVALLVFPRATADAISALLTGGRTERGQTMEMAKSAIKEVGNIVAGAYLTAFSNMTGTRLIEHVPEVACDTFGSVMSQIVGQFSTLSTNVLVTEVQFSLLPDHWLAYLLLAFKWEDSHRIFGLRENARTPEDLEKVRAGRSG